VSRNLGGDDHRGERFTGDDDGGEGGVPQVQWDVELPGRGARGDLRLGGGDALTAQIQPQRHRFPTNYTHEDRGTAGGSGQRP